MPVFVLPLMLFLLGFILIIKGGDWFVDASVWLAEILHIPHMIIGATIVSLCTTLPELMVSTLAISSGSPELAISNALGSVICNTGLILGISMVFMPSTIHKKTFTIKSILLFVSLLTMAVFAIDLKINILEGISLFIILIVFMVYSIKMALRARRDTMKSLDEVLGIDRSDKIENIAKFVFGATGIILGAKLLVDNGIFLAGIMGVSEQLVGLTMVALGTSLPELVTTISAIRKKQFSLSVGNVIGANIMNITLIISTCAVISKDGLVVSLQNLAYIGKNIPQSLVIDLPVAIALTAIVVIPAILRGKFSRMQGVIALCSYGVYIGFLVVTSL